jgi:hypothetical protein
MPHTHPKDWIDVLAALSPTVAVLVAIGVAVVQAYLQKEALKQNLYDRRFRVYSAVLELWEALRKAEDVDEREFAAAVLPATHLFGSDVQKYVSGIKDRLFRLRGQYKSQEKAKERNDLVRFIAHDFEVCFDPYLQLHYDENLLSRLKAQVDGWVDGADAKMASRYGSR